MVDRTCEICSNIMHLNSHIHEVSILSNFFCHKRDITHSISEWLKLSFTLENVKVEPWDYSAKNMFSCGPAYEMLESDRKYFSKYTTNLTRFFFVSNALEETYRLIQSNYTPEMNTTNRSKITSNTIKAIMLMENIEDKFIPNELKHLCEKLSVFFDIFTKEFKPREDGLQLNYSDSHNCRGLDIIRKLRNYIAHGIFPINLNPEFDGLNNTTHNLMRFLNLSTRISTMYIQIFLSKYGMNFDKDGYVNFIGYTKWIEDVNHNSEDKDKTLLDYSKSIPETNDIILNIHLDGSFGFNYFWED